MTSRTGGGVSRRTFLGSVAAVPFAARVDARMLLSGAPRVAVVGAGAFGGWTALQFARLGARVTLLDAWGPGNSRSSSGGESRVIRAIYGADRIYVEMVKRAYELWELLDAGTDDRLYTETGALWMHRGDDAYVRSSIESLTDLGFPVDKLTLEDAARRYPQIDFGGIQSVWLERRAGALSARRACLAVRDAFTKAGGTYRTAHVEPGPIAKGSMASLKLGDGSAIEADAYVFACGPWLGRLFPDVLGEAIKPSRQEVYYFGVPRGSQRYAAGQLPVWIDFGSSIIYGVPDLDGRGFKVADDTRGELVDPTSLHRVASEEGLTNARRLLRQRFPELAAAPLIEARVCQYENSPDGHLIVDRHPAAKNAWLVGGGSGHGFKLAPAVGEMTAHAVIAGKATPELFRLERLRSAKKPSTQFDSKREGAR